MKFEPIFMKLDYSIKVKNKWRYEGERAAVTTSENTDDEGMLTSSVCADNESDLEDFYPSDPMISAALARAITDSEDEGGTPSTSLTPALSKQPSVINSDDENNHVEEMESDFALSIDVMPSFSDILDHSDDDLLDDLPSIEPTRSSRESSGDSIRFIPSHFEESDEEETLAHDLPRTERQRMPKKDSRQRKVVAKSGEQDIMTQALSSMVSSAIQNTVMGTLQNLAAKSNPRLTQSSGDRYASIHSDSDDEVDDHGYEGAHKARRGSGETASLDIEEEFDFLEEYDIGSAEEKD